MVDGKSVQLLGDIDALHVPTAPALPHGDTVRAIAAAAGLPVPKVVTAPRAVLTVAGLVVPTVRELRETLHQFEHDWVIDSSLAERTFGLSATPLSDGARATIAALRGTTEAAVAA